MTTEEVKEFLNQGFEIKKKIENLKFKYENIHSQHNSIENNTISKNNSNEIKFVKGTDIKIKIEVLEMNLDNITRNIEEFIEDSNIDEKYQVILIYRYCYLETFSKIASELNFSQRYIYQLHNIALEKISVSFQC